MSNNRKILTAFFAALVLCAPSPAGLKKGNKTAAESGEITGTEIVNVLWREPSDIRTRNLFYGPGGADHQPHSVYTFEKEDLDGTNPKFVVRDENGVRWKVKLGEEAKPETVASRLVWAVGYFADEDYFLPELRVKEMPAHLKRRGAKKFIAPDGTMRNVRLKRYLDGEKKVGIWSWRNDPFAGTREYNGLRVMMALINNWDLKDVNNAIYEEKRHTGSGFERVYLVSDLGASFGSWGLELTHKKSKGNLDEYTRHKFIRRIGAEEVDFETPHRPAMLVLFNPHEFLMRVHLEWIGHHVPRTAAKWMGEQLAQLSPGQIRDAFRAAGYSPAEIDGFSTVLESRIAELNRL
ncbi:MAG TPA: hypothetical protein VKT81_08120 [Bryobacteraceae bacterium]|nr:hypothetical protein [Bryobacteraceae bacterium]